MIAVIYIDGPAASAHWDVAGTPMIIRQLEWLIASGLRRVIVERPASDERWDAMQRTLESHAAAAAIETILTPHPLGASEVARRAGVAHEPFIAISSRVLGNADLRQISGFSPGTKALLRPPKGFASLFDGSLSVISERSSVTTSAQSVDGWGVALESERDAHELGAAVLAGSLDGVLVHGAERAPGVWVARGGSLSEEAIVHAPVYIGPSSKVLAGATVGPNAVLGERVLLSRGAIVREAIVRDDTIVGEGLVIEHCAAQGADIEDWTTGTTASPSDPLLLAPRVQRERVAWTSRVLALIASLLMIPVLLTAHGRALWRELLEVVKGQRCWLGANSAPSEEDLAHVPLARAANRAPLGVISVERAMHVDGDDRLRMLAWYAGEKCLRLDASLLYQRVMQSITPA